MKKKFCLLLIAGLLFSCSVTTPDSSVTTSTGGENSDSPQTSSESIEQDSNSKDSSIDNPIESISSENSSLEDSTSSNTTSENSSIINTSITSNTTSVDLSTSETSSQTSSSFTSLPDDDINLVDSVQEGLILHAYNLKYTNIKSKLASIKEAGYTAVQTSPVQQPKDYNPSWINRDGQWWKLYQPLSFSIAKQSWLGTKSELTDLCKEAEKYDIKIICDVVLNHMANNDNEGRVVNPNIATYEAQIYNNRSTYFHEFYGSSDNDIKGVVRGAIGLPDLATENSYVQSRAISLLKECIDCGVDGFRFDAAKHIETPDDGEYKSDFWPNVINSATDYAKSKGNDLYCYGEILNNPGVGRSFSSYTKYLSVTDNKTGNEIRSAMASKNASGTLKKQYVSGQNPDKLVLWSESHDTYEDKSSYNVNGSDINKAWALVASRKDATALYFMRPGESMNTSKNNDYCSKEVSEVNKFHNYFNGCEENLGVDSTYSYVERYNNSRSGIVVVDCSSSNQNINISVSHLRNGTYKDKVSGNTFTCSNGKLTGKMGASGICVLYSESNAPYVNISNLVSSFSTDTYTLNVEVGNCTNATYQINSNSPVSFNNSTSIVIGNGMNYGDQVSIKFVVTDGKDTITKTVVVKKEKVSEATYYFDPSECSWFGNDNAEMAISINGGKYEKMSKNSDDFYYYTTGKKITSLKIARQVLNGNTYNYYNELNVNCSNLANGMKFVINKDFNGGNWVNYK